MKQITLNSLTLRNYKRMKEYVLELNQVTSIYGTNETGKTTLANAFIWLFWGKDKYDRKDFEIKTLDANNEPIHKIDHEVCGIFDVDGVELKIQRIYHEKWTKPRGEEFEVLKGHETEFKWNDVPLQLQEFVKKINDLIGDEMLFKMLTNPLFFNDDKMVPWLKRREILTTIAKCDLSDQEIAERDPKFKALFDKLTGKSLVEYKRELAASKKLLNEKLKSVPTRIDELNRNTPEIPEQGYEAIEQEIINLSKEVDIIDHKIEDKSKLSEEFYQKKSERAKKIGELKLKIGRIEQDASNKIAIKSNKRNADLLSAEQLLNNIKKSIEKDSVTIANNNERIKSIDLQPLRDQIAQINELKFTFDADECICPTCRRKLDDDDVEKQEAELLANFNTENAKRKADINKKGIALKNEITELEKQNLELEQSIDLARESLSEVEQDITTLKGATDAKVTNYGDEYNKLQSDLKELEFENSQAEPTVNLDDLKNSKLPIQQKIAELSKLLSAKDQIEKSKIRLAELQQESKSLAQQISNLEKDEFTIEQFTKVKIELIEDPINGMFTTLKFKMFETQINEGINEVCQCLINGVPFAAANSASQVNAGIEIINVLNKHFGISLPILIDNREGVVSLIETNNQVINFYVSKNDLTLRVE